VQLTAVYAGTFDPVTHGHLDVMARAARMYHHLVIAVAASPGKKPMFDLQQRTDLFRQLTTAHDNISIEPFKGLLVEFAAQRGATVLIRGLRSGTDFDYEMQIASFNRRMHPEIDTVFVSADPQYSFISSTLVREIATLGGDVSSFVDPVVEKALRQVVNKS